VFAQSCSAVAGIFRSLRERAVGKFYILNLKFNAMAAGRRLQSLAPHERIGDATYAAIRGAIIGRVLAPGSRLVVDRLARDLNVSRTPVKEALAKLEREGFVTTVPRRGASVTTITREDLEDIYLLREVVEGLSARLAAMRVAEAILGRLDALIDHGATVLAAQDFDAYAELGVEFHRQIRIASGHRRLQALMENLEGQMRLLISTSAALPGRRLLSVAEHRQIKAALERRDPAAAEAAMRRHVANALTALRDHWPDRGKAEGRGATSERDSLARGIHAPPAGGGGTWVGDGRVEGS
jgi:DNA-binding GntR family transcriptional regulator